MKPLSAGDIDNVGVGSSDGDGADGLSWLVIENRVPGSAVVVGFPDSAVDLAHIENIRLAGNAGGGAGAASAKWADHAPVQILICVSGNLLSETETG